MINDMSDESYWELGKLIGAYLCGKKTLDQVMDGINQIMTFDIWEMLSKSLDSIDGYGPASPYDEPLIAETKLFSPAKIRAGNACTAG